jgi:hypothetical protein
MLHNALPLQRLTLIHHPTQLATTFSTLLSATLNANSFTEESNAPGVHSLAPTSTGGGRRVVLDVAKLTPGREDYYLERLADDREEYLSGHGESPGRWYGRGAASLGLGAC